MIPQIVQHNTRLVTRADDLRKRVSADVNRMLRNIREWRALTDVLAADIIPRVWFHIVQGLKQVAFNARHSFIRGWDVMEERTLVYVTAEYYQTARRYEEMLNYSLGASADNATKHLWYFLIERDLETRLNLVERAIDNVTFLNQSYTNASAIYYFKQTPDKRYEST